MPPSAIAPVCTKVATRRLRTSQSPCTTPCRRIRTLYRLPLTSDPSCCSGTGVVVNRSHCTNAAAGHCIVRYGVALRIRRWGLLRVHLRQHRCIHVRRYRPRRVLVRRPECPVRQRRRFKTFYRRAGGNHVTVPLPGRCFRRRGLQRSQQQCGMRWVTVLISHLTSKIAVEDVCVAYPKACLSGAGFIYS